MQEARTHQLLAVVRGVEGLFRCDRELVKKVVERIGKLLNEVRRLRGATTVKVMNFCGTHEWTVTYFGLRSMMPEGLELVAGPGCPVCVTPSHYLEEAIRLGLDGVTIYTYGDVYRLRSVRPVRGFTSLSELRGHADVRLVTGLVDAVRDARATKRPSVFVGIGFETVASGYAAAIERAALPENLKFMSLVKLTPPAMAHTLEVHAHGSPPERMGVIAPGHVSTIIGASAWAPISERYRVPVVVSGFEPLDVLLSVAEILRQLATGEARTTVEYTRAVKWEGDLRAQSLIMRVFEVVDDVWRGIGVIPASGLRLRDKYKIIDAFAEYGVRELGPGHWSYDLAPGCRCADVILGRAKPTDCPLFGRACRPESPYGPCMVSVEGACSIWARYGSATLLREALSELGAGV